MTDRAATVAECLAVAVAMGESREVTARDVWQAYARVAIARGVEAAVDELRDWREGL